jgi:DNA-binding NtrC family response regulator
MERKPQVPPGVALPWNLEEAEEILIGRALEETGGNVTEAARLLGVHRMRIYRTLARQKKGGSARTP